MCVVTNHMESKKIDSEDTKDFFWMKYMKKWFGKWDELHLLRRASIVFFVNEDFCNAIELESNKDVRIHVSHIILHVIHQTVVPS